MYTAESDSSSKEEVEPKIQSVKSYQEYVESKASDKEKIANIDIGDHNPKALKARILDFLRQRPHWFALNPLSPPRVVAATGSGHGPTSTMGMPTWSNMKTLDTLLKRLENGFRVVSIAFEKVEIDRRIFSHTL